MHLLGSPNDCVDRARLYAQRAADARAFIDDGNRTFALDTIVAVERNNRFAEQARDTCYTLGTTGWALVVARAAVRNRFSVWTACGITAFGALCLRQYILDTVSERFVKIGHGATLSAICTMQESNASAAAHGGSGRMVVYVQ
jgi:hypothetical protein